MGGEYTNRAYSSYRHRLPCDEKELQILLISIFHQLQLLYCASNRGGKFKTYVINSALQRALLNLAEDFDLTKSIHTLLLEQGQFDKRHYRVSDLRRFSEYARILGFKDNKRYKPDKLIPFNRPRGWLVGYYFLEKPVLPHGADMKLQNAKYMLDSKRYIPPEIEEALDQAEYWQITEFRPSLAGKPTR